MLVRCIKCDRERSDKYMQQAVFADWHWPSVSEPVDVWRCAAVQSCKTYRKKMRKDGDLPQDTNAVQA